MDENPELMPNSLLSAKRVSEGRDDPPRYSFLLLWSAASRSRTARRV
jgi:hypothetical protein